MLRNLGFALLAWTLSSGLSTGASLLDNGRPVVDIPGKGRVLGIEENFNNFTYFAFKGIPFAQPPIDELRFKDPVESEGWEGDLDASEFPAVCLQKLLTMEGDEDCLYLSVYTPQNALDTGNKDPLPVMVFIHGGYLLFGSMRSFDKCHPIIEKDVILVNLQYRLGVLGFLSTEDSAAPGNLGLKDQTLALKWIKENIASFGGDPNKITIFGESAGSYSVSYQMLVPSAEGLFQGVIMQSGNALSPGAPGRNFLQNAQAIAKDLGCPEYPSDELVSCLQEQLATILTDKNSAFYEWHTHPMVFGPRVDGSYIPDEPLTLLKEKRYSHVPVIMGMCRDEGALFSVDLYAFNKSVLQPLLDDFDKNGPVSLELLPEESALNTAYEVYEYYLPGIVIGEEQADNATLMNGHRYFQIPTDWAAEMMATEIPVFMYELHHRGQYGLVDSYLAYHALLPPQATNWVSHSDDLQYLFEQLQPLTTEDDLAVREIFANTWTNFAKTLDPTPDESLGYKWDRIGTTGLRHFTILPDPLMEDDSRFTDRQLWNSLPLKQNPYREFVH